MSVVIFHVIADYARKKGSREAAFYVGVSRLVIGYAAFTKALADWKNSDLSAGRGCEARKKGSREAAFYVGVSRLELPTTRPPDAYANQLRHTPNDVHFCFAGAKVTRKNGLCKSRACFFA